MLGSIKYNLSNLLNFKGRDARQTFWFYVLFLVILQYAAGLLISMPMMGGIMRGAFSAARQGVTEGEMQARMIAQMAGYMRTSVILTSIVSIVGALLLFAAFVRRLHDSNRPGWIALVPIALSLGAKALTWARLDQIITAMTKGGADNPDGMFSLQSGVLEASVVGWLAILVVVFFGAWPSTPGPNRYGEAPVRF